ncbi:MAG: hypothetical protein ACRBBR_15070 [Cellvibrionaceae bacterium]
MDARKLVIKPTIDKSRQKGDMGAEVYYESKKCNVEVYTGPLAKRMSALQLLANDLKQVIEFIEIYESSSQTSRFALFQAIAISYGRCYVVGKKRGLSLDEEKVFKNDKNLLKTHRDMINLRHKTIAHADSDESCETQISIVHPPEDNEDLSCIILCAARGGPGAYTIQQIEKFRPVPKYALKYVENAINDCQRKILCDA